MARTVATRPAGSLALVRVAASKRKYLFGVRWWVAGYAASVVWQLFGPDWHIAGSGANLPFVLTTIAVLGYWARQRRDAIWIERDESELRIFSRRGWHRDPKAPDTDATSIKRYPSSANVVYDDSAKWWHASRSLQIDADMYAIFPEGRTLAADIADPQRWLATSVKADEVLFD